MRIQDLAQKHNNVSAQEPKPIVTPTVQRLLETQDDQFSKSMTGEELITWLKSL